MEECYFSKVAGLNSTELDKASYKGAHLGERGLGVWTPTLFRYSRNCALIFLNRFRRIVLKNQFKKRKNPKRCTNSILSKFFNTTLRRILKRGPHQ